MKNKIKDSREDFPYCVQAIHAMRGASIYEKGNYTILPLPLHLAKLLEEYFI